MLIPTQIRVRVRRAMRLAATFGLLVTMTTALTGCGSTSKSGSMDSAVRDYHGQNYGAAHQEAAAVMAKSSGSERERAAYVAGLSAYQSGDIAAAERELTVAAGSSTPQIAGNAKAMLGQICLDQHRPRQAATYFCDASRLLQGEDARQAAWHAGLAYREAGDEASAKRWLDTASSSQFDTTQPRVVSTSGNASTSTNKPVASSANPTTPRPALAAETAGKTTVGFTLQVGAFNDKKRAKQAAEDAEALSRRENLGRVKVIPTKDARGQTLYLVHVGWWVTRSEAASARDRVGKLEYIVAPAPAT